MELKPCPFCGCEAMLGGDSESGAEYGLYVFCTSTTCFVAMGEGYDRDAMPDHSFRTEEAAVEAWNTRSEVKPGEKL